MIKKIWNVGSVLVLALGAIVASGCHSTFNPIETVKFQPGADSKSARLSLVFKKTIQGNYAGALTLGNYGYVFVDPFTATSEPFEVGFSLDLSVFDDPNYAKLAVTSTLPN